MKRFGLTSPRIYQSLTFNYQFNDPLKQSFAAVFLFTIPTIHIMAYLISICQYIRGKMERFMMYDTRLSTA